MFCMKKKKIGLGVFGYTGLNIEASRMLENQLITGVGSRKVPYLRYLLSYWRFVTTIG